MRLPAARVRALFEALLLTVVASVLLSLLTGGPSLGVMAPVLLVGALMFLHGVSTKVTASADRLSVRELWYRRTVDLDDLTLVEVVPNGPRFQLRLSDGSGRTLRTRLQLVRADPEIWERVTTAVRHARFDTWRHDPLTASWFERAGNGPVDSDPQT